MNNVMQLFKGLLKFRMTSAKIVSPLPTVSLETILIWYSEGASRSYFLEAISHSFI